MTLRFVMPAAVQDNLADVAAAAEPSMTGPLRAHALIENTRNGDVTHDVQVELTDVAWRTLVGDFAARVRWLHEGGAAIFTTLLEAGKRPGGTSQQDALTLLVTQLAGPTFIGSAHSLPPTFTHTPDEASASASTCPSPPTSPCSAAAAGTSSSRRSSPTPAACASTGPTCA